MDAQQLEQKYNQLVSDYNMCQENLLDAESAVVEEISRNGFASKKIRQQVEQAQEQLNDIDFELFCFKGNNADFVAKLKTDRKARREQEAEKSFEAFWNN